MNVTIRVWPSELGADVEMDRGTHKTSFSMDDNDIYRLKIALDDWFSKERRYAKASGFYSLADERPYGFVTTFGGE